MSGKIDPCSVFQNAWNTTVGPLTNDVLKGYPVVINKVIDGLNSTIPVFLAGINGIVTGINDTVNGTGQVINNFTYATGELAGILIGFLLPTQFIASLKFMITEIIGPIVQDATGYSIQTAVIIVIVFLIMMPTIGMVYMFYNLVFGLLFE